MATSKVSKSKIKIKVAKKTRPTVVVKKTSGLSVGLFNILGRSAGTLELPKEIFGVKVNENLLAQAVRVYLFNQRQGTSSTKTRGEVHGSTKKIWQQKGTGRARHGSRKAPIFRHGGIVSGPKPQDHSLNLSKKMKRSALFSALTQKLKSNEIKTITGLEKIEPKTKKMVALIEKLGVNKKNRNVLLVIPNKVKDFENIYRAVRNIEGVQALSANTLNAYQVLDNNLMILMKQSIDSLKENFLKK